MFTGWLAIGAQELGNSARYAAYAAELGLPGLRPVIAPAGLAAVLADPDYAAAGVAGAPWHDSAAPESTGFGGVYIRSITGLDVSPSTRTVTELPGGGGVPSVARDKPRTMLVTAWLAAVSDLSLSYGLAWLDAVLHDDCAGGCAGDTMCLLAAEPVCATGTQAQADACWLDLARTVHDVVCVDGPTVTSTVALSSGGCAPGAAGRPVGATVEFTLVAGSPGIYRWPEIVADGLTFNAPAPVSGCQIEWIPVGPGRARTCPPPVRCGPPGGCADDPLNAAADLVPLYRTAGLCMARESEAWTAGTASPGLVPRWLDSVPIITVSPGPADIRRLTIRLHANPMLETVTGPDDLDPCTAVAEVGVSWLARETTLVIDGRTRDAYVICPGGAREPAGHLLTGPDGGPFVWPRVVCGALVSVLALADAGFYHPDASVTVELAARAGVA